MNQEVCQSYIGIELVRSSWNLFSPFLQRRFIFICISKYCTVYCSLTTAVKLCLFKSERATLVLIPSNHSDNPVYFSSVLSELWASQPSLLSHRSSIYNVTMTTGRVKVMKMNRFVKYAGRKAWVSGCHVVLWIYVSALSNNKLLDVRLVAAAKD